MAQVAELQGLEDAFKFATTYRTVVERKSAVHSAQLAFEVSREGMPEYVDYMDAIENYKISKAEHKEAREKFQEYIRHSYHDSVSSNN